LKYLSYLLFIGCLFTVLNSPLLIAQDEDKGVKEEFVLVYLYNGSVIHGSLIERGEDVVLTVEGETLSIPYSLIRKIEIYTGSLRQFKMGEKIRVNAPHLPRANSFYHSTQLGMMISGNSWEPLSFSIRVINGYQWTPHLAIGFGLGLDRYYNQLIVPIFAEVKADLLPSKGISPLFFVGLGDGLLINKVPSTDNFQENAGLYWQTGVGLRATMGQKTSFIISAGQQSQAYKTRWYWSENEWGGTAWEEVTLQAFRRIFVRAGLIF